MVFSVIASDAQVIILKTEIISQVTSHIAQQKTTTLYQKLLHISVKTYNFRMLKKLTILMRKVIPTLEE